jgi:diguanylate cyclase (GGDEF)-like protein
MERLWELIDILVPDTVKQAPDGEELLRARVVICFLVVSVGNCIVAAASSLSGTTQLPFLVPAIAPIYLGCLIGYLSALAIFRRWAAFTVVGNMSIAFCYGGVVLISTRLPAAWAPGSLLVLFALPPLMDLLSGFRGALAWGAIIAATGPIMVNARLIAIEPPSLVGWETAGGGILLAISAGHFYRKGVVDRLTAERARIEAAARRDTLTGLANRAAFEHHVEQRIELCKHNRGRVALIIVDLDDFKPINDTHGHHVGDMALQIVAQRMLQGRCATDMAARFGGDEFALVLALDGDANVEAVTRQLSASIEYPMRLPIGTVSIGCSCGVAIYPQDGDTPHQLALKADLRMYEAKRKRKAGSISTGRSARTVLF